MEAKNEVGKQKVPILNLEDLFDLEELESKQAPCGADGGIHPFAPCHNHNETLLRDDIVPTAPLAIELDLEELESRQAPCDVGGGIVPFGKCHNHNETLRRDI